ncbi:thioesterase [Catenulispora sp. NL8]|uniref:Thioesterase n=1 Tax=Catenulispora pinistramenti TaxID=2705254 RepID=A0ABS5KR62_9ACTN|nr:thioesterase [Catenulispora pinistramenti]MBS2548528.1 thioesterase [Catenulispora pinistramenti]
MTSVLERSGAWLPAADPDRTLRLICFPHAGGTPSLYHDWPRLLDPAIQVVPVLLAGRGLRSHQQPVSVLQPLVQEVVQALVRAGHTDRFAMFGHSMGALLAYEVACALRDRGLPEPEHLFVSASKAPHLYGAAAGWPTNDTDLRRMVGELGGLGPDEEMGLAYLERRLPVLRADLRLCAEYVWTPRTPLNCPMTAFSADGDPVATPAQMEAWREYTANSLLRRHLPDGHFYLNHDAGRAALLRFVRADLDRLFHTVGAGHTHQLPEDSRWTG